MHERTKPMARQTPAADGSKSTEWLADNLGKPRSSSSTPPITCRRRSATPRPNISPAISRARCSSTSTPSPTIRPICRTCCRARPVRRQRSARSASPRPTPSSSMTAAGSIRRRACGGRFRIFGAKNVYILDGGLPAWKAEGRPTEAGEVKRHGQAHSRPRWTPARSPCSRDVQMALNDRKRAGGRCAFGRALCRPRAPSRAPACAPATCRARSTCRSPRSSRTAVSPRRKRSRQAFKKAGVDTRQADHHQLRLRRHRGGAGARPRRARQAAAAHLRRLLVGMGRGADLPVAKD